MIIITAFFKFIIIDYYRGLHHNDMLGIGTYLYQQRLCWTAP